LFLTKKLKPFVSSGIDFFENQIPGSRTISGFHSVFAVVVGVVGVRVVDPGGAVAYRAVRVVGGVQGTVGRLVKTKKSLLFHRESFVSRNLCAKLKTDFKTDF
jgi:hypothetical protein